MQGKASSPNEVNEMLMSVRELLRQDPDAKLIVALRRALADPIKPETSNGRFRPHPLLVLSVTAAGIMLAVFAYFSYLHQ